LLSIDHFRPSAALDHAAASIFPPLGFAILISVRQKTGRSTSISQQMPNSIC
jgi:hypothetical protein